MVSVCRFVGVGCVCMLVCAVGMYVLVRGAVVGMCCFCVGQCNGVFHVYV